MPPSIVNTIIMMNIMRFSSDSFYYTLWHFYILRMELEGGGRGGEEGVVGEGRRDGVVGWGEEGGGLLPHPEPLPHTSYSPKG